jgi:hypothetical protein
MKSDRAPISERWWIARNDRRFASLIGVVLFAVFFLLFEFILPPPSTLSFIEAHAETLSYFVVNPDLSRVRARGTLLTRDPLPESDSGCTELTPALHSLVSYTRRRGTSLIIEVAEPDENGHLPDDASYALVGATACGCVVSDSEVGAEDCNDLRLPIRGPGTLGGLYASAEDSLLLLEGRLGVFGRSIWKGTLYPVEDNLPLPAGSRVSTGDVTVPPEAALVGFAAPGESDLAVSVTTEAREILLSPPGGGIRPVRIQISKFARLFDDPFLLWLHVYVGVLLLLLKLTADLLEWGRRPKKEPRKEPAA